MGKRRFVLQWSIRTLLLLTAAVAVWVAFFKMRREVPPLEARIAAMRALARELIVEDEQKMARTLRRGLEHEGYAVDLAADGDQALSLGTEYDYDAIVLNYMNWEVPAPGEAREDWDILCDLSTRMAVVGNRMRHQQSRPPFAGTF